MPLRPKPSSGQAGECVNTNEKALDETLPYTSNYKQDVSEGSAVETRFLLITDL